MRTRRKVVPCLLVLFACVPAAPAVAAEATLTVAGGYDSKNAKTLERDGKTYIVRSSDNQWFDVEAGHRLALRFTGAVPAGATIQRVRVAIERHEESGISASAIRWDVGGGTVTSPATALTRTPALRRGEGAEGTDEWDVSAAIRTPAQVNGLVFQVRNVAGNGKKGKVDRVRVFVTYSVQATAPSITSTPPTTGVAGRAYAYQPTATGTAPITWSLLTGPSGMTVDPGTGRVSWTPSAAGSFPISLRAANSAGASSQNYTVAVSAAPEPTATATATPTATPPPGAATVLAAGDIADCNSSGDEQTAAVLDANPLGTVLTLGDTVYESGTAAEFANCYQPSWGRHKARTRPAPGNHEYETAGAAGYYGYFGAAAGPGTRGYYSFDVGAWHIVSLNSEVDTGASGAQLAWLRADLAATNASCVLAFMHRPRFTAGNYSDFTTMTPFWDALYAANAELVLSGHDHIYERYAPMTPAGTFDGARGIRQFVVGTGGRGHYALRADARREAGSSGTFGVLRLTLNATSYDWRFLPVAGGIYADSGTGSCH